MRKAKRGTAKRATKKPQKAKSPAESRAKNRAPRSRVSLARLLDELARANARLTVELVPKSCWYSNVRSNVTEAQWDYLRRVVYKRAGWICEICGGHGDTYPVAC